MAFASISRALPGTLHGRIQIMARPVTKYAKVSKKQRDQLRHLLRTHRLPSHRRRAHAILLSDQEYAAAEIAEIIEAHPESVRVWIDQFNEHGIDGLEDRPRSGGTPMLNDDQQQSLRDLMETFPNQPRKVISELASETGGVRRRAPGSGLVFGFQPNSAGECDLH